MLVNPQICILKDGTVSTHTVDNLKSQIIAPAYRFTSSLHLEKLFKLSEACVFTYSLMIMLVKHLMGMLLISGGKMKMVIWGNNLYRWRDYMCDISNNYLSSAKEVKGKEILHVLSSFLNIKAGLSNPAKW